MIIRIKHDKANNAVTAPKIATDSVSADKIVGVSKLIFATCTLDFPSIPSHEFRFERCPVTGVNQAAGDTVVVTNNGILTPPDTVTVYNRLVTYTGSPLGVNEITITLGNEADFAIDPDPQTFSVIIFHQ